jgi:hypothetical protein
MAVMRSAKERRWRWQQAVWRWQQALAKLAKYARKYQRSAKRRLSASAAFMPARWQRQRLRWPRSALARQRLTAKDMKINIIWQTSAKAKMAAYQRGVALIESVAKRAAKKRRKA